MTDDPAIDDRAELQAELERLQRREVELSSEVRRLRAELERLRSEEISRRHERPPHWG